MRTNATALLAALMIIGATQAQTTNGVSVTTTAATNIKGTTATVGGTVTLSPLAPAVTERGVVFGTVTDPKRATGRVVGGSGAGTFSVNLTGLTAGTLTNAWAFATNSKGITFGKMISFTTLSIPLVTTTAPTSITARSAASGGNVTNGGATTVTARGVCFSTTPNPAPPLATCTSNGAGTGVFTSAITGLQPSQTIFVRAFATNSVGTGFGAQQTFTTPAAAPRFIDLQPRPTSASAENRKLFAGVPSQSFGNFAYLNIPDAFCAGIPAGTLVDRFNCTNGAQCSIYEHTLAQLPPVIYKAANLGDSAAGPFTVELYRTEIVNGNASALTQVNSSQVVGLAAGATSGTFSFTPTFPGGLRVYTQDFSPGKCFVRRAISGSGTNYPYLEGSYVVKVDGGNSAGGGVVRERFENNNEGDPIPTP